MPTNVEIPEIGVIEFPDGMKPEEITKAAADLYNKAQKEKQPTSSAIGAGLRAGATGVVPSLAGAGGFAAGFEAGLPLAPFAGPAAPIVPFVTGGIGAMLGSTVAAKGQQAIIHKAAPQFEQQQQADVAQHPIASAVGGIASALPVFEVSPGQSIKGIAAIPSLIRGEATALQRKAAAATAVQLGTQGGLAVAQPLISEGRLPSKGELAEAGISALIYGNPRIKALLPRSLAAVTGAPLKGTPDASQITQALAPKAPLLVNAAVRIGGKVETGKNHPEILLRVGGQELSDKYPSRESRNTPDFGFVDESGNFLNREQSAERAKVTGQQLEADEVQPHSDQIASPTQPGKSISETGLSKEHQEALFKEAENIGRKVRVVSEDDLDPGNAPFAQSVRGKIATIDRGSGTILINPKELGDWLTQDVPRGKEAEAVRSILSEENIHLATRDEWAKAYHDSLTPLERSIGQRVYGGPNAKEPLNPTMLGHEMLRTRIQQLARMPIKEVVERATTAKENAWKVKSLLTIGRAVQGIRETLGTKASKEGLKYLDKVQGNLDAAIAVAQGAAAGAVRKPAFAEKYDEETLFQRPAWVTPGSALDKVLGELREKRDRFSDRDVTGIWKDLTPEQRQDLAARGWLSGVTRKYGQVTLHLGSDAISAKNFFDVHNRIRQREPQEPAATRKRRETLFYDEHDNAIVEASPSFRVSVNNPNSATHAVVWTPQVVGDKTYWRKSGSISSHETTKKVGGQEGKYLTVESVQVEKGQQGKGLGRKLYETLLSQSEDSVDGIISHTPNRVNRREVPAIYKRLGAFQEGDFQVIKKQKYEPAAQRKRRETSEQGIMYLPPVAQVPERATATEVGAPEYTTKKQLAPHAVGFDQAGASALRAISEAESGSPKELASILTEGARTGGTKVPPSRTHRVTALFDRQTGRVDVVSTYKEAGEVKMGDPTLLSEDKARPHRPLERLLDRYQPLYSVYLTDPVQNFHERFESMEQFQKEFALPAREASEGALGAQVKSDLDHTPYVRPTYAEAPHPDDVGALYDAVKKFPASSPEKMRQAIVRKPIAFSKKALQALDAMVTREMVNNKNLSAEAAIGNSLDKLYENATQSSSRDDFTQRTMGDFAPRTPETTGQAQAAPTPRPSISGARELTTPRFARTSVPAGQIEPPLRGTPPQAPGLLSPESQALVKQQSARQRANDPEVIAKTPQVIYRQLGARAVPQERYSMGKAKPIERTEAPEEVVKPDYEQEEFIGKLARSEGEPEPEPPAAIRKVLAESRDRSMAEVERVKNAFSAYIQRREIKDAIPALQDSADTMANNNADQAGIRVSMAAGAEGAGLRGADKQLNSTHTLIAAHAITSEYNLAKAGPEARKRFSDLLKIDPSVLRARGMMKSDPVEAARLIAEARQNAFQQLISEKLLSTANAKYGFNDKAKDSIDALLKKVDNAQAKQEALLKTGTYQQKAEARKMLKYLPKLRESAQWAKDNWTNPELRRSAFQLKKELDESFQQQVDGGKVLRYDRDYVPGRYEDEFYSENHIVFPGRRTLGLKWGQPKTFANYFVAAENGFQAVTLNAANLVSHSVRQAQRSINYGRWLDTLKSVSDPATGLAIAQEPAVGPDGKPKVPSFDYTLVPVNSKTTLAIHNGYVDLIRALTSESKVQEFPPARIALELAQRIKHTILVGDVFHLARVSYYAQAIAGLKRVAGWHQGLAAIQFRPEDLAQAVKQGVISQKAADWALTKIPVKQGGKTFDMTRREIAVKMMERGLNVGQIQDALYLDLTQGIPVVGPLIQKYNRLLFNRITRGLMMESAVHEFERLNAKHPNVDSESLMRDIARDTNRFFGSIGRQGWFKSRTWQDLSRLSFLAPQWVEGLVDKEAALPKRLVGGALSSVGLPGGRQGLPKLGTLGGGIANGLVAMLALTQAINLITRRKPTWQNEEPEHKWDAWLPGGKNGFFLSPLAVFNELTHDLVRLFQSKPKAWDAVQQIGQNKLGPFGHMALILATDKSPRGEYQTTSGGVLKEAGKSLLPVPISFGTVGRAGAAKVLPGLVSPPPEGAAQRQMLQWVGLKAEPAQGAAQRIGRMAQQFSQASGKGGTGFVFQPTDDPSYAKLRSALRNGDEKTAKAVLSQLEQNRPMQQIGKAMKEWAHRPFTGSKRMERAFINSLTPQDQELYSQAMQEKQRDFESFLELLSRR